MLSKLTYNILNPKVMTTLWQTEDFLKSFVNPAPIATNGLKKGFFGTRKSWKSP